MSTANHTVTTLKNFTPSNVSFDEPTKNKMGSNVVYLHYDNQVLNLQTPWMRAPYGISSMVDDNTKATKYSLNVSFDNMNEDSANYNPTIKLFHDKLKGFQDTLLNAAQKNSKKWLGKQMKLEQVEVLSTPLIKTTEKTNAKGELYSPTFKMKFPMYMNKLSCVDLSGNYFDPKNITNGCQVKAIISCRSVWFVMGKFGVSFTIEALRVKPQAKISAFSFVNDDDDDVPEDDEEEEEEEEEEESS